MVDFLAKSLSLYEKYLKYFLGGNADHVLRWRLHIFFLGTMKYRFVVASHSCSRFSRHIVATKAAQTQQQFEQFTRFVAGAREGINCDITSLVPAWAFGTNVNGLIKP